MPFRAAVMKIALHRFVNLLSGSKRQTGEVFLYMAEVFLLLRLVWGGCRSAEGRGAAFFEKVGTCFLLSGGKNFSGGGPFCSDRHDRLWGIPGRRDTAAGRVQKPTDVFMPECRPLLS